MAPFQPGPMDAVARAINVAAPDALETHQDIALPARLDLFQLICKRDRGSGFEPHDRPDIPHVGGPFRRGVEADLMTSLGHAGSQPLQIRFRAPAGRKSAPDKSYGKLVRSHLRDMETLLGSNRHNTC
jgi:hypothetical protein